MELTVIEQNGQFLVDSREVAEMTGKQHDQLMRSIRTYIEYLESAKMQSRQFFIEYTYVNSQNKRQPCYLLTCKGCDMVANKMTGEKGVLFTATYVTKFEEMENKLKEMNQPKLPMTYKEALVALLDEVEKNEKLELQNKQLEKENKHKETVIVGLVEEITLEEKRQILNTVMRKGTPSQIQERWKLLYSHYEKKVHINLDYQYKKYNQEHKPKMKNKLDYVDKVRDDIPLVYSIACKLFENDVEKLVQEIYKLNNVENISFDTSLQIH